MSVSNCGSSTPKSPPLVNSIHEFHSLDTPAPAMSASSGGHADPHQPGAAADELVVALDELLLGPGRAEGRGQPVGDDEVDPHEHEEGAGEDDGQGDLGPEHALPDARRGPSESNQR